MNNGAAASSTTSSASAALVAEWSINTWLGDDFHISVTDMNRLIMDYLITEGYKEAAEKFREEANVHYPVEACSESLDARIHIRIAIREGRIRDAIRLINNLHPELLDVNKYLHFHLLQQELIELIRGSKIEQALIFAQEHLAEKGEQNETLLNELEQTMALLAFEQPDKSPFSQLMHFSQREKVAAETNAALLECEHRPSAPKLEALVQLVHWAQDQLDKHNVHYPKMVDFSRATVQPPQNNNNSNKQTSK